MKIKKIVLIVLAIAFIGAAVGMFFGFVMPKFRDENILKNGKEATALIIDVDTNSSVNDEEYYYIEFQFVNDSGQYITAKTNSAYTIYDLEDLGYVTLDYGRYEYYVNYGTTIQIKYIGNNAVAKDYVADPTGSFMWVFVAIFGAVGIGMLVGFILTIVKDAIDKKIQSEGIDGMGTFLHHSIGMRVNNVPYFKIHFTFMNQTGEMVEMKTGSKYLAHEVDALMSMNTFPVRYIGNKAVINVPKQELLSIRHTGN